MERLLNAVLSVVALLSPSRVEALSDRIRNSNSKDRLLDVNKLVTTPAARSSLEKVAALWEQSNISSDELAGIFLAAAFARKQALMETKIDFVWTGPTTPFVPTRRTEQVLLDLINKARETIFLVSFVAYDISSVVTALNAAFSRGVELKILLESSKEHGGSLSVNPIAVMQKCVPQASLYVWTSRSEPFFDGRVHAKVAVADSAIAFITSANLTAHALEKNMEAGVLIEGGEIPKNLSEHLNALIETNIIIKV